MKKIILLIGMLFVNAAPTVADMINGDRGMSLGEGIIIENKAPKGLEVLATKLDSHVGMPENEGSHGTVKYCYHTDVYVVNRANPLGQDMNYQKIFPKV